MKLLIAGITGQLGRGLIEAAPHEGVTNITALARRRGRRALPTFEGVSILEGDVGLRLWGLNSESLDELAGSVDGVVNVAAETDWLAPRQRLLRVNIAGAVHGLELARDLRERAGRPIVYCHASSVYVAGSRLGNVPEIPFGGDEHRTAYEQSKWEGEHYVLTNGGEGVCVARIGGLIGAVTTGSTRRRNSLYLLADSARLLPLRVLPATRGARVDVLPRDRAATLLLRAVAAMQTVWPTEAQIVHIAAGEGAPSLRSLLSTAAHLDVEGQLSLPRVVCVPPAVIYAVSESAAWLPSLGARHRTLLTGIRYTGLPRLFERGRLAGLIGDLPAPVPVETVARLTFDLSQPAAVAWNPADGLGRFTPCSSW